ncbi:hypothetical protein [Sinomonas humi]|uniref:hypothetical protein n=1 Tax=Sinomonas humi TaxID=1338436 RepID=UPI0012E05592|nr:hypothetical protein [Sinomonas humi]
MVHLNLDPASYELLKSVAREEERSLRVVAARAIRTYAAAEAEEEVLNGTSRPEPA